MKKRLLPEHELELLIAAVEVDTEPRGDYRFICRECLGEFLQVAHTGARRKYCGRCAELVYVKRYGREEGLRKALELSEHNVERARARGGCYGD